MGLPCSDYLSILLFNILLSIQTSLSPAHRVHVYCPLLSFEQ